MDSWHAMQCAHLDSADRAGEIEANFAWTGKHMSAKVVRRWAINLPKLSQWPVATVH